MPDSDKIRHRIYDWENAARSANATRDMNGIALLSAMRDGRLPMPPINATMGLRLQEVSDTGVTFTLMLEEWHYNQTGSGHGGVHATLLDSAMGCAVQAGLLAGVSYTTLDLSVKYLRPARISAGPLTCRGEVVSRGRRVATAQGRIRDQDERLIATGTATCLIVPSVPI